MRCTASGSAVGTLPSSSPVVGLNDSSVAAAATDSSVAAIAADYGLRDPAGVDLRALDERLGEQRAQTMRQPLVDDDRLGIRVGFEVDGADADDGLGPADGSHGTDHHAAARVVAHEALELQLADLDAALGQQRADSGQVGAPREAKAHARPGGQF